MRDHMRTPFSITGGHVMSGLSERYFDWLYARVCDVRDLNSPYSYSVVCDYMHQISFKTLVPHDDNRAAYGIGLRNEFMLQETYLPSPRDLAILMGPDTASIFEVLVALASQANFLIEYSERTWFNIFLTNLGLVTFNDYQYTPRQKYRIIRIIERFNNRTYRADGNGGLFPLKRPDEDQRETELWYQMAAYMTEKAMY
jgi:hypothetical protein